MLHNKGFTLIELLVTVTVLAIVVAIAIPSFNTQMQNSRTEALGEELISTLAYARTEAVKRAGRVTVCPSTNGTECNTPLWENGWIVFVDYAANDAAAPLTVSGGQSVILRRWNAITGGIRVAVESGGNSEDFIRFTSLGALARWQNPPTPVVIDVRLDECTGLNVRQLTIGISGMVNARNIDCES